MRVVTILASSIMAVAPSAAFAADLDGKTFGVLWALPFAGILLSIALFPLLAPQFWEHHQGKIAALWAVLILIPLTLMRGADVSGGALAHTIIGEYVPFILLLLALFTTAGGILISGNIHGSPGMNTALLAIGALMASLIGTTGASMVMIRPVMRANDERRHNVHVVVFFIFLVSNIGGSLTPLGDPPLFLGFLRGVDFFWTTTHLFTETLLVAAILLAVFFLLDSWFYHRDAAFKARRDPTPDSPVKLHGLGNLALIGVIILAILMSAAWKPGVAFTVLGTPVEWQNLARDGIFVAVTFASLAGADIPVARQKEILEKLGYGVTETADAFTCAVPSWRPDVHGEADLVEEVCRIWGLDNIPAQPMERTSAIARPVLNRLQKRMLGARRALASRGFNEAITWAFLPEEHARLFGGGQPELKLANPISSELSDMRPSLLPNLIAAAGRNMDRGFAGMMLAEVGHAYAGDRPQDETLRAAGIRRGAFTGRNVHGGSRAVDAFDAKADALAVLEAAGAPVATVQVVAGAPAWFHPGRSGTIQMGPQNKLGYFGEIHPRVLAAMDVKGPLVAFEIILNAIPPSKQKGATRPPLVTSDLMPLSRDFAFVVDDAVEAEKLVKAARSADKALIADVTVFDLYKLEGGKTSLAIEVTLQPKDKTLTEPEIEAVSAKIVQAVNKATGGTLRS